VGSVLHPTRLLHLDGGMGASPMVDPCSSGPPVVDPSGRCRSSDFFPFLSPISVASICLFQFLERYVSVGVFVVVAVVFMFLVQ
jgi:hypothetical protein